MSTKRGSNVHIRVDWRSKTPAHRQIVEQLRAAVAAGALTAGDQLPTVRRLGRQARVHFNTVARAYRQLDQAGIVSTQRGRGTYVLGRKRPGRARGGRGELRTLSREHVGAALRLGFTPEEVRHALERALADERSARKRKGGT